MLISLFKQFHWLFEDKETDQGDCLTAFCCFEKNEHFFLYLDCTWMTVVDCQFISCLLQLILRYLKPVNS